MVGVQTVVDLTPYMLEATYDPNAAGLIGMAQIEPGFIRLPVNTVKVASADLRNSDDAEGEAISTSAFVVFNPELKFTLTNGIKGVLRIIFQMKDATTRTSSAAVYVNGVQVGAVQTQGNTYAAKSQDINVGILYSGTTIELKGHSDASGVKCMGKEFRLYYADKTIGVAVATT